MKILRILHRPGMVLVRGVNGMARSKRTSGANRFARQRVFARLRNGDEGNAIIEFALVLPVLITVLLGIFIVGIIFNNQIILTQAVGGGAQYLQSLSTSATGIDPCALTNTYIAGAATTLTGTITVKVSINGGTGVTTCSLADITPTAGASKTIAVTGTYPCNFVILGVNIMAANVVAGTNPTGCQISAKSAVVIPSSS